MATRPIRIRTPEELELRKKGLFELADILEKNGFRFFLAFGALLGAVREKGFIPWDWDVELCVYTEEVYPRREELLTLLKDAGFEILRADFPKDNFKIDVAKYTDSETTSYTICGWYKENAIWRRRVLKVPAKFFDTLDEIEFLGRTFNCPHAAEDFLVYEYGADWRTPKQTGDIEEYLTAAAYSPEYAVEGTPGASIRAFKRIVKKILRSLYKGV